MKTIKVSNGFVQGCVKKVLGKDIAEFLSIPYCMAPTNDRRFMKPQESVFSNEVINHSKFITCPPQTIMKIFSNNKDEQLWIPEEVQSEDCLYLNIWCPVSILEGSESHSVFVWIYGGGFVSGSSSLPIYNGSILAVQENIIVVSFNYRIGALGFLCLDDEISGNQGIYDQVAALKWVHENIIHFNGNPCDVTIGGNSAGGASVTLHLLIEESWKYYNKIIIESGVCLSDWAFHPKNELVAQSVEIVNKLLAKYNSPLQWHKGLEKDAKNEIIKILKSIDSNEFLDESIFTKCILNLAWLPCVDGLLIKDSPEVLFKTKKFKSCPSIFLNVENEGTFFLLHQFPNINIDDSNMVDIKYFDECLKYYRWYPRLCSIEIKNEIIKKYNIESKKISLGKLDEIISDRHFVADSVRLASYMSENFNSVHYIWFRISPTGTDWPNWVGTMHGDEIYYLFGYGFLENDGTQLNELCQKYMNNMGNFIKNGSLSDEWPLYKSNASNYILIENNRWSASTFSDDQKDKFKFWEELRIRSN